MRERFDMKIIFQVNMKTEKPKAFKEMERVEEVEEKILQGYGRVHTLKFNLNECKELC